jgi:vacuolar iron transporter family protein
VSSVPPVPDGKAAITPADDRLARQLILDELFDLSLYRALREVTAGELQAMLDELIRVETRHFAFWQEFFGLRVDSLDPGRRVKLWLLTLAGRLFGAPAIHFILEAIEVYGVRKYLALWEAYRDGPLGGAVRGILEDEFKHEDAVVTGMAERRINPDRVRNIFLGLNDGLVEILGAVSGFFAAFQSAATVLVAGFTVAVAGSLSMAAGAYGATSSEAEVRQTEAGRRRFLGEGGADSVLGESPVTSAIVVGGAYFVGALIPVLPVLAGARTVVPSLLAGGSLIIVVTLVLAFLSGMNIRRRIVTNLVIIAVAVGVSYAIGAAARWLFGISV